MWLQLLRTVPAPRLAPPGTPWHPCSCPGDASPWGGGAAGSGRRGEGRGRRGLCLGLWAPGLRASRSAAGAAWAGRGAGRRGGAPPRPRPTPRRPRGLRPSLSVSEPGWGRGGLAARCPRGRAGGLGGGGKVRGSLAARRRRFRFRFLAAELRVCGRGERPVPLPGLRWDPAHGGAAGGRGVPVPSCGWELLSLGKGQSAALGVLRTLPSAKGRKQQQPNENKTAALKNKQKAERSWAVSVTGRGVCRALLRACCHTALSGWGCLLRLHP